MHQSSINILPASLIHTPLVLAISLAPAFSLEAFNLSETIDAITVFPTRDTRVVNACKYVCDDVREGSGAARNDDLWTDQVQRHSRRPLLPPAAWFSLLTCFEKYCLVVP